MNILFLQYEAENFFHYFKHKNQVLRFPGNLKLLTRSRKCPLFMDEA